MQDIRENEMGAQAHKHSSLKLKNKQQDSSIVD